MNDKTTKRVCVGQPGRIPTFLNVAARPLGRAYLGMCLVLCCASHIGRADTLVAPNDRASQSGNTSFSDGFAGPGTFQFVYGSKNFSATARPISITGMAFRVNEGQAGGSFDAVIPRITIQISTYRGTLASFNASSYAANAGSDSIVAYDGPVHWMTTDLPGSGPNPFDLVVLFQHPFDYDPASGDLLMSFSNSTQGVNGMDAVDAHDHGDATIGWIGFPGSFNVPGTTVRETIVSQFQFVQVPEPGIVGLVALGGCAILAYKRKRVA